MTHCANILAPSSAWASTTEPKRSRSVASQLGNALRALKPRARKAMKTDSKVCALNVDALNELDDCDQLKRSWSDDEASTRSGGSSPSLPGSVEEECSTSRRSSRSSS